MNINIFECTLKDKSMFPCPFAEGVEGVTSSIYSGQKFVCCGNAGKMLYVNAIEALEQERFEKLNIDNVFGEMEKDCPYAKKYLMVEKLGEDKK